MTEERRFNRNLRVHSSQSLTLEDIIDELRSAWREPRETMNEGIRHVVSLSKQGVLSDDEVSTLLKSILAEFIANKADSMLAETRLYPFMTGWYPTTESRHRLSGISLAQALYR